MEIQKKIRAVFKKRIENDLYKRFLRNDNLTDRVERLTLENKKEWTVSYVTD